MYEPIHFREESTARQAALIRAHPLGLLITAGAGGLMANPVPFLFDAERRVLRAHLARANPQWRDLGQDLGQDLGRDPEDGAECLVVFQGPDSYVTPSWYATKRETGRVVPTWNYATVQVRGRARAIEDEAWLRRQIADLTALREGTRAEPWAVDDAPAPFVAAQVRAIVGIEIAVAQMTGKWKVSQNRPEADRAGVVAGLSEAGDAAMAALVAEHGGVP